MNQILLVEGKDDFSVFNNLFEKYNVNKTFQIIEKSGINEMFKSLPIYVKTDNTTIGMVIDADQDINTKWESLKSILSNIGYNVSGKPLEGGTIIIDEVLPNVGIWIMPDNNENGMLEDFIRYLIPNDDELISIVEDTLISVESKGLNRYKLIHKSKAKIHNWLAWQETPGTPLGLAIKKRYFDTEHEICHHFIDWINRLYNAPDSAAL